MLLNVTDNHVDLWLTVLVTTVVLVQWDPVAPNRVFKGKKLPGRMGGEQVTIQNLEIVRVDAERNLLLS